MVEVSGMPAGVGLMHGGFHGPNQALEEALERRIPDFLAADAGSTDAGPAFLGGDKGMTHREGIKQSLEYILPLALNKKVPFIVGSAALGGNAPGLQSFREIVEEISREKGLHFRVAFIDSEQDKGYLQQRLKDGKIKPLAPSPNLTEDDINRSTHIVGMMGTEPLVKALEQGAQVIIAGRTSDSALFAAVPIMKGIPLAPAWHMAKVIDHAATNIEPVPGVETSVIGIAGEDYFRVEPTNPLGICDAMRTAHATVYENNSPMHLYEPPGMLDISKCYFQQMTPNIVKVTGMTFDRKPYTIKLEGAEKVGYRAITLGGTRDPVVIGIVDEFLQVCKDRSIEHAKAQGINPENFKLFFRVYGKNEVMRDWEPESNLSARELGIVADCVADTQEIANAVMNMCHAQLLHYNYPGRIHTTGNFAFPYSPSDIECGPVYQFNVWHLLEPDDPLECCSIDIVDL